MSLEIRSKCSSNVGAQSKMQSSDSLSNVELYFVIKRMTSLALHANCGVSKSDSAFGYVGTCVGEIVVDDGYALKININIIEIKIITSACRAITAQALHANMLDSCKCPTVIHLNMRNYTNTRSIFYKLDITQTRFRESAIRNTFPITPQSHKDNENK